MQLLDIALGAKGSIAQQADLFRQFCFGVAERLDGVLHVVEFDHGGVSLLAGLGESALRRLELDGDGSLAFQPPTEILDLGLLLPLRRLARGVSNLEGLETLLGMPQLRAELLEERTARCLAHFIANPCFGFLCGVGAGGGDFFVLEHPQFLHLGIHVLLKSLQLEVECGDLALCVLELGLEVCDAGSRRVNV